MSRVGTSGRCGGMCRVGRVFIAMVAALTVGCRAPTAIDPATLDAPELAAIVRAYEAAVAAAHADPEVAWHTGWIGNLRVNLSGARHAGLCWEWRDLVYGAVCPAAEQHGWQVLGIHVFRNTPSEHNALVVFDPQATAREILLPRNRRGDLVARGGAPVEAWVLDPWKSGEARVYALDDWVAEARQRRWPVDLEDPPFAVGERTYQGR